MSEPFVRHKKLNSKSNHSLNLLVSGFGLQSIVPVDDIVERVSRLPVSHINPIQVIKYDPSKNISFLLRHQRVGPQLGEYLKGFNSVVIYRFRSTEECYHVLFHEIGHSVYFKTISSFEKKEWVTKVYVKESGVSELGCRNACEDFAESYAFYLMKPDWLKQKFPNKFSFISQLFK